FRAAAAVISNFDGEHLGRPQRASHSYGEQPDGPASGDGHALRRDLAGQHCVHRIPQWIQNRCVLLRYCWIKLPDIRLRNTNVLSKRPVRIDPDDFHKLADVRFAGTALQTLAAGDVHLSGNEIAFLDAGDLLTVSHHLAAELVPWNQWWMNPSLRPAVPVINVEVGPADGGNFHLDQYVGSANFGKGNVADFNSRLRLRFDHRQHGIGHERHLRSGE